MGAPGQGPPLLLASEALREELAPETPLARSTRRVCLLVSLLLAASGVGLVLGGTPAALQGALEGASAAVVVLGIGLSNLPYATRAHGLMGLGGALLLGALAGRGPAGALVQGVAGAALPWEIARVFAATLLPAALVFRAHYRAFPMARLLLGWGLVLGLPFAIRSAYVVVMAPSLSERLAAGATLGSMMLALLGFMGTQTTAGGSLWAVSLLSSLALDVAARLFLPGEKARALLHLATASSFLLAAGLCALGLFQTLAQALAPAARRDAEARWKRGWSEG